MNVKQHQQHNISNQCNRCRHKSAHIIMCVMCRGVSSIQTLLVTVTCSGGLLVVGGTAPEGRHCTGRCIIHYSVTVLVPLASVTMSVPLASDAKDRNQRSLGHDRSTKTQRLGLPPVKETSQTF